MTSRNDAESHLAKATECLQAAELSLELSLANAACSNAITAGINARDAVCLLLVGHTRKSDNHAAAAAGLAASGAVGRELRTTFERLLRLKPRSQYQASSVSQADPQRAVDWARRMVLAARSVVS